MHERDDELVIPAWRRVAGDAAELLHDLAWLIGFGAVSVVSSFTRGRAGQTVRRQLDRSTGMVRQTLATR
jgi:hypothetical protein